MSSDDDSEPGDGTDIIHFNWILCTKINIALIITKIVHYREGVLWSGVYYRQGMSSKRGSTVIIMTHIYLLRI